jgi:CheY-like chemotaxis protein
MVKSESKPTGVPYLALLVDDSEDDAFFLTRALQAHGQLRCAVRLGNGAEALKYLSREGPYADQLQFPDPHLLLLDLKMPVVDGFGVLRHLREHLPNRKFKVVVLTNSDAEEDIRRSKELGADGFEVKPREMTGYYALVDRLREFLDATAELTAQE